MTLYNPEIYLESAIRGIQDYVESNVDQSVYDVVMEFPGPSLDESNTPLRKTVIHFEIDDMTDAPVGFGDGIFQENFDPDSQTANPQYATMHTINFDVGIWASDASGGTTSRMRARQILNNLFGLPHGIELLKTATDGGDGHVELRSYSGGRFDTDRINDLPVYRMLGGELMVRVFSRTPISDTPAPTIESILQDPDLTIIG